jgi:hypothetical protein
MMKGAGIVYNKWNISVTICDTDNPSHGGDRKTFEVTAST